MPPEVVREPLTGGFDNGAGALPCHPKSHLRNGEGGNGDSNAIAVTRREWICLVEGLAAESASGCGGRVCDTPTRRVLGVRWWRRSAYTACALSGANCDDLVALVVGTEEMLASCCICLWLRLEVPWLKVLSGQEGGQAAVTACGCRSESRDASDWCGGPRDLRSLLPPGCERGASREATLWLDEASGRALDCTWH